MIPLLFLLLATQATARSDLGCTDTDCLRVRLNVAMQRLLGTAPDPARQAEIMTTQVLWSAYRDMQCGLDPAREADCQRRQTDWRIEELERTARP